MRSPRGLGLGEVDWTSVATGRPEDASCARDGGSGGRHTGCLLLAGVVMAYAGLVWLVWQGAGWLVDQAGRLAGG